MDSRLDFAGRLKAQCFLQDLVVFDMKIEALKKKVAMAELMEIAANANATGHTKMFVIPDGPVKRAIQAAYFEKSGAESSGAESLGPELRGAASSDGHVVEEEWRNVKISRMLPVDMKEPASSEVDAALGHGVEEERGNTKLTAQKERIKKKKKEAQNAVKVSSAILSDHLSSCSFPVVKKRYGWEVAYICSL